MAGRRRARRFHPGFDLAQYKDLGPGVNPETAPGKTVAPVASFLNITKAADRPFLSQEKLSP